MSAEKIALRLLSFRWLTKKKLAEKLATRGIEEAEIASVSRRMEELGYLNDERYAEMWLREKMAQGKWGPTRLKLELIRQGIEPQLADRLLEEIFPPGSAQELELAFHLARKKAKLAGTEPKARGKIGAALARAGFSSEVIWRVLDSLQDEKVLDSE